MVNFYNILDFQILYMRKINKTEKILILNYNVGYLLYIFREYQKHFFHDYPQYLFNVFYCK